MVLKTTSSKVLTPFQCHGHRRVELYLYSPSGPHRTCSGITLPLPLPLLMNKRTRTFEVVWQSYSLRHYMSSTATFLAICVMPVAGGWYFIKKFILFLFILFSQPMWIYYNVYFRYFPHNSGYPITPQWYTVRTLALLLLSPVSKVLGLWRVWGRRGWCIGSWWGNRRERDQWGDLGVDGWIILGWMWVYGLDWAGPG